jgi:hypothetical protein
VVRGNEERKADFFSLSSQRPLDTGKGEEKHCSKFSGSDSFRASDDEEVDIGIFVKGVEGNRVAKVDFFDEGERFVEGGVFFDFGKVFVH